MSGGLHLLHLTRDHPPAAKGGLSIAVRWLASLGAQLGHRVTIVSFDDWRPKRAQDLSAPAIVDEQGLDGGVVLRIRSAGQLTELHQRMAAEAPDWVHVHHGTLWEHAAHIGGRRMLCVHVLQAELNRLRGVERTWSGDCQRAAMEAAELVQVSNSATAELLLSHHPTLTPKLQVLPLDSANPPAQPWSPRGRELVSVGRFDVSKGTADFIAVSAALRRLGLIDRATLIGGVPANRRAERRWAQQIEAHPFLSWTGWLDANSLSERLAGASLALFPSHAETLGLGLLEALTAGVPVVAADVSGHRALLGGSERGLLATAGDVESLTFACAQALRSPAEAAARAAQAQAWLSDQRPRWRESWRLLWQSA